MESKPVFELHKLPQGFIVTSDTLPKDFYNCLMLCTITNKLVNSVGASHIGYFKKVIAQHDQIDFSALKEEEQKEIGWFDVGYLKSKCFPVSVYDKKAGDFQIGFEKGFQKAQELLSDRRFSLEDMFKVLDLMKHIAKTSSNLAVMEVEGRRLIESLSQKSWKVEIQHVCEGVKKEGESCTLNNKCTYPNCGKIKILKLW